MKKALITLSVIVALTVASAVASKMDQFQLSLSFSILSTVPLFYIAHQLDKK
jgi:hypothetical protein